MTQSDIARPLRALVRARAHERCEYCQTSEWISGLACEIDHIIPRAAGGQTTDTSLCLACAACNAYKGSTTHAADPSSGSTVALFSPRQQKWTEHLSWGEDGVTIVGLTSCGRATVIALRLNNPFLVAARALWVSAGWHPPAMV